MPLWGCIALCFLVSFVSMWFFRRKDIPKPHKHIQRVLVGFVIGAAISSIVGKKMMDRAKGNDEEETNEEGDR